LEPLFYAMESHKNTCKRLKVVEELKTKNRVFVHAAMCLNDPFLVLSN